MCLKDKNLICTFNYKSKNLSSNIFFLILNLNSFLFVPMEHHDTKHSTTYTDILNEDIEKKLEKIEIYKKFITYINNSESSFDKNSSSFTSLNNPYYDDYIRKKKSNNINMSDNIRLADEDIIQDLNDISNEKGLKVRVLDSSLYIKINRFSKHDRVIVRSQKDEYVGTITCVDTDDLVIKGRDGRRNRIKLDDIRDENIEITKYLK